jgi:hypothetical protein
MQIAGVVAFRAGMSWCGLYMGLGLFVELPALGGEFAGILMWIVWNAVCVHCRWVDRWLF